MSTAWTTPDDVRAWVRRRWTDGSLLRAYAGGAPFPVVDRPVRGPAPGVIGDDLPAVRSWIDTLESGSRSGERYAVGYATVGGRLIGRNRVPARVRVERYDQAWALLGVGREVRRLEAILDLVSAEPVVRDWVVEHPQRALTAGDGAGDEWRRLLAAYRWLDDHRGSGAYLREITAPGVDTKFAERHRGVLAALLGVSTTAPGFLSGLGLHARPELTRLRMAASVGVGLPVTELAVRRDELPGLDLTVRTVIVVENEVTYLSVPVPMDGVVLWGRGFEVGHAGRLPWLRRAAVHYWGDLDTHGFAILHQLRAVLPTARSVLMDEATLLAHRDRWVTEDRPTSARLRGLTPEESALYADLVTDRFGPAVRLEQERIDWAWALDRLPAE